MVSLNKLRKCKKKGYLFTNLKEKINHLMYMDDIKIFASYEKNEEPFYKLRINT